MLQVWAEDRAHLLGIVDAQGENRQAGASPFQAQAQATGELMAQSKLHLEIVRHCQCGAVLKEGEGGLCPPCLAKRAAETPALVAAAEQPSTIQQQADLQGELKPAEGTRAAILQEYDECPECRKRLVPR